MLGVTLPSSTIYAHSGLSRLPTLLWNHCHLGDVKDQGSSGKAGNRNVCVLRDRVCFYSFRPKEWTLPYTYSQEAK